MEAALTKPIKPALRHVAIIMGGIELWGQARGLARIEGHLAGLEAARRTVQMVRKMGPSHLTLYSFSAEYLRRSLEDVDNLFVLIQDYIEHDLPTLVSENILVKIIGDRNSLPRSLKIFF